MTLPANITDDFGTNTNDDPITEKQLSYLTQLIAERPAWALTAGLSSAVLRTLTKTAASEWISSATDIARENGYHPTGGALALTELREGSYWTIRGEVARVRRSDKTQRLYAEVLDADLGKFNYIKGTIYNLAGRMTFDEAKAWGGKGRQMLRVRQTTYRSK